MPTTHTIQQGETLTRIAQQYKFSSWKDLYNHPDNVEFRTLRDDPNLILPGDQIIIPAPQPKKTAAKGGESHIYKLKNQPEKLSIKIQNKVGTPWKGKKVIFIFDNQEKEVQLDENGSLEIILSKTNKTEGELRFFMDQDSEKPSYIFNLKLGHLDPIGELSGIQARCNSLGYNAGEENGEMNNQTQWAIKSFQANHGLEKTGEADSETKDKIREVYGC